MGIIHQGNSVFHLAEAFVNQTQYNIYLTGKAGTGKNTFLQHIRDSSAKNNIVTAPTGVAAINAGGVTLHYLFLLPNGTFIPENYPIRFGDPSRADRA